MAKKKDDRKRSLTPADTKAAERLRALWDRVVPERKATDSPLTQLVMAETLSRYTGKGSQGAISQYLNGDIALNFKAVLAFADELGCEPEEIRSDLPEQRAARAAAHQALETRTPGAFNNQVENDIDAIAYAVSSLFAQLASERPGEGERLAAAMREEIPDVFAENGLIRKLLQTLDKGARKAKTRRTSSSS